MRKNNFELGLLAKRQQSLGRVHHVTSRAVRSQSPGSMVIATCFLPIPSLTRMLPPRVLSTDPYLHSAAWGLIHAAVSRFRMTWVVKKEFIQHCGADDK